MNFVNKTLSRLQTTSACFDDKLALLRNELVEILNGKSVYVLDGGRGVVGEIVDKSLEKTKDSIVKDYIEKNLFAGKKPNTAGEMFQSLFSDNVLVENIDLAKSSFLVENYRQKAGLIVLAGSPLDWDASLDDQFCYLAKDYLQIYESARSGKIPLLGVCFGFQTLASVVDGLSVKALNRKIKRHVLVHSVCGQELSLYSNHGQGVKMRAGEFKSQKIQPLFYHRKLLYGALIIDEGYTALGLQMHPEGMILQTLVDVAVLSDLDDDDFLRMINMRSDSLKFVLEKVLAYLRDSL